MYLYDTNDPGIIANNSIILTDNFGRVPQLECISGSKMPDVGRWLTPSGQDTTLSANDPFDVTVGGQDDPGYLDVALSPGLILTFRDQGVYTCHIPDETGMNVSVFVGIYLPALARE